MHVYSTNTLLYMHNYFISFSTKQNLLLINLASSKRQVLFLFPCFVLFLMYISSVVVILNIFHFLFWETLSNTLLLKMYCITLLVMFHYSLLNLTIYNVAALINRFTHFLEQASCRTKTSFRKSEKKGMNILVS